ncbi:arylsulfatase I-like [Ixodes scapularis]|uniref:arylsulfatase I-like n=1 Tax=Ixodes scapularis TaxID=6945 RepID=UPI001C384F58|nr:arylsulfatase I-like [Ixodes scapularis]
MCGMQHSVIKPAEPWALPLNYTLMPDYFRCLGYKTHMVGKWHLGYYDRQYVPIKRGFDTFLGFYNPSLDYYNQNFKGVCLLISCMVDALDQSIGIVVDTLQKAGMLNDTIIVFCSDNGALPWGFKSNRGYNWPLRGGKFTLYEGGVRGTAFLWSRRLKNTKRVSNQLMHISDWLPTLYSSAGGNVSDLGNIDGVDMWDSLSASHKSQRDMVVLNINSVLNYSAIRVGDYKLIEGRFNKSLYDQRFETVGGKRPLDDLEALMNECVAASALRDLYKPEPLQFSPYWRAEAKINCSNEPSSVDIHQDTFYLFNIKEDPCETNNLVCEKTEAGKLNELKKLLADLKKEEAKPLNKPADPAAYPECHNGIWDHWTPTV